MDPQTRTVKVRAERTTREAGFGPRCFDVSTAWKAVFRLSMVALTLAYGTDDYFARRVLCECSHGGALEKLEAFARRVATLPGHSDPMCGGPRKTSRQINSMI